MIKKFEIQDRRFNLEKGAGSDSRVFNLNKNNCLNPCNQSLKKLK